MYKSRECCAQAPQAPQAPRALGLRGTPAMPCDALCVRHRPMPACRGGGVALASHDAEAVAGSAVAGSAVLCSHGHTCDDTLVPHSHDPHTASISQVIETKRDMVLSLPPDTFCMLVCHEIVPQL